MESYQYESLNQHKTRFPRTLWNDEKPFRLIRLLPGQFSDDLMVELVVGSLTLHSSKRPRYQALSYVWGSQENKEWAYARTEGRGLKGLRITQNLSSALRHFRRESVAITMWVDAVCINQEDIPERNEQVAMMANIYQQADQVTVWLGPEENDSALAFQLLRKLADRIETIDWRTHTVVWQVPLPEPIAVDGRAARAFSQLVRRPWFERLWVLQEIYSAQKASVWCGRETMSWEVFRTGFAVMSMDDTRVAIEQQLDPLDLESFDSRRKRILRLTMGAKPQFLYLRNFLGSVQCTDPRDRIFGLLNFLGDGAMPKGYRPNYFLNTREVYIDAVTQHLRHTNSLGILASCDLQGPNFSDDLPSWVPDFRLPRQTSDTTVPVSAASSLLRSRFSIKNGILESGAVKVAKITGTKRMEYASPATVSKEAFETMIRDTWQFAIQDSDPAFHEDRQAYLDAFCAALCGGNFQHCYVPLRAIDPPFEDCRETMTDLLENERSNASNSIPSIPDSESWQKYITTARNMCQNRSFITTGRSLCGLAPLTAKAGDEIFVVLSCDRPLVLRALDDNTYKIVGEAVVPGIHAGEAVLGSLPDSVRLVNYYYQERNYWYSGLWDEKTKKMLVGDPRVKRDEIWRRVFIPFLRPRYEVLREVGVDFRVISVV
jgi:hypothetical protein